MQAIADNTFTLTTPDRRQMVFLEQSSGTIRGLLVAPLSRSAIFVGKALGVGAFVTVVELIVVPVTASTTGLVVGANATWPTSV